MQAIKIYSNPPRSDWDKLSKRPFAQDPSIERSVRKIIKRVKENGDKALKKFTREFDGVKLKKLLVPEIEIENSIAGIDEDLKNAILIARKNIESFHSSQKEQITKVNTLPGIECWRESKPIERVGIYIPGGSAPLFSTVLMLGIPAYIAGCKEIILCTPPTKDGTIHPAILYSAQLCGIKQIYKVGGAQAIAAMAYGTESVPKVMKIFGPGNNYVTFAKQFVQQEGIAIDMPAGPSEVLIIADSTASPEFLAADLLSQAEHGADSQVMLVTNDANKVQAVQDAVSSQLQKLSRKEIARQSLSSSCIIVVKGLEEAIDFSNNYAPEHLIIACKDPEIYINRIAAAGSVFLGHYSPESAGDYATGTNHTLPTNGYAKAYSGVSLDSFVKKITFQRLTLEGLQNIGPAVMKMAETEGLDAHRNSVAIRLK